MAKKDGYIAISDEENGIPCSKEQKISLGTRRTLEVIAVVMIIIAMLATGYVLGAQKTDVVESMVPGYSKHNTY